MIASEEPMIVAEGLTKQFGTTKALAGVDLQVAAGTVVGLLGPNGAGKTTVVRILATLCRPDGGRASIAGFDLATQAEQVRRTIGLAGQYAAVDEALTGRENLQIFGSLYHMGRSASRRRAEELLEQFDLAHAANRLVKTYSGGMRRRLDLASSLIVAPRVLFLDEPTTGLDPRSRIEVWASIKELAAAGTTVLLTTQYLDEADHLADRVAVIDAGKVIAEGTPDELKSEVGGDQIEVVVADPADLTAAAAVLGRITAVAPTLDPDRSAARAALAGGFANLAAAVRELDQAGIAVRDLTVRRSTLDDVFLYYTGHGLMEMPETAAPAGRGRGGH